MGLKKSNGEIQTKKSRMIEEAARLVIRSKVSTWATLISDKEARRVFILFVERNATNISLLDVWGPGMLIESIHLDGIMIKLLKSNMTDDSKTSLYDMIMRDIKAE